MTSPHAHSPLVRNIFFISGLVATFAYRAIIILNHVSSLWSTIAWYIGTVGFIVYFIHRYQVSEKRAHLIRQYNLNERIASSRELSTDEKAAMEYIVDTLVSSKEKWNSIFIFVSSGIALVVGIILDFLV